MFLYIFACMYFILNSFAKVIVPTVLVQFFQSVTKQEIHENKYKNTFHEQQIAQNIHSHDVFI